MYKKLVFYMVVSVLVVSAVSNSSASPVPIAWWSFNETGGSTLHDQIGSADGTCTAGVTFAPGVFGNAGSIPEGDFISLGNPSVLDLGRGDLTYTGWLKADPIPDGVAGYNMVIEFGKHNAGGFNIWVGPGNRGWQGKLGFDAKGTADNISLFSNGRVDDGQWHWFACVVDNLNVSMYIDDLLQDAQPAYGPTTTANAPETLDQKIGTSYDGLLDDLALYGSALTRVHDTEGYLTGGELYDVWQNGVVPEPATIALLGLGSLVLLRKKQKRC